MKRSIRLAAGAAVCTVLFILASCASEPKEIPPDLTSNELVQRAQEASDSKNYDLAISYYHVLMDRFGTDPSILCTGEYEIAFIYYKQGKYAESRTLFETLLARYEEPAGVELPVSYKILAEKVLPEVKKALGETP